MQERQPLKTRFEKLKWDAKIMVLINNPEKSHLYLLKFTWTDEFLEA